MKRKTSGSYKRTYKKSKTNKEIDRFRNVSNGTIPRSLSLKQGETRITSIARTVDLGTTTLSAATTTTFANYFTLSQLSNYTEFTNLFDAFRIVAIKFEWVATESLSSYYNSTIPATVLTNYPILVSCIDTDDANVPANESVILEHESARVHGAFQPTRKYIRWVKPHVAIEAYQTGGFGGYINKPNQWVDTGSPATQHYGIKYAMITNAATPAVNFQTYATLYIDFKYPI